MRTIAFWCAILMACIMSGQSRAAEVAFYNNTVYFQEGYYSTVYYLPLQVGTYSVTTHSTGLTPIDISGGGDGRLCALYPNQLLCNMGGFPLGMDYDTVDSGGGFIALSDYPTNTTRVRIPGGAFITYPFFTHTSLASEFGCGVDTGSVANCWNNFGNPVSPPGIVRNGVLDLAVGAGTSTWWLTTLHGNGQVTIWDRLTNSMPPNNYSNAWAVAMDGDDVCVVDRHLVTLDFTVYCSHLNQPGGLWTTEYGPTPDLPQAELYGGYLIVLEQGMVTMSMY